MGIRSFLKRNAVFIASAACILIVRGTFADQNYVPTGSMEPTIQVGDHILVNKTAYDLKLPYSKIALARLNEPQRGDIIVFLHPRTGMRMVKRLIALPGDRVHIENGFVSINGQLLPGSIDGMRDFRESEKEEIVYSEKVGPHLAQVRRVHAWAHPENFEFEVPAEQYFAMGDNRDNSSDSRVWGFVPRANVEGRAVGVIYNMAWSPLHVAPERTANKFD